MKLCLAFLLAAVYLLAVPFLARAANARPSAREPVSLVVQ